MSISNETDNIIKQVESNAEKRNSNNIARILHTSRMSNRIDPTVFHQIKLRIVKEMAALIEPTLGPYGQKILLQPRGAHGTVSYATKDGWECLNNLSYPYDDPIPHAIMFLVNDIPNSMNFHVGDGTTSGVPIVKKLYELMHEKFIESDEYKVSPIGLINLLNAIEEDLKENCVGLRKHEDITYKKVPLIDRNNNPVVDNNNEQVYRDEIENIDVTYKYNPKYVKQMDKNDENESMKMVNRVAAVSANNDTKIAGMIAELFKNKFNSVFPFVNLKLNEQEDGEDIIVKASGFEIDHGYTDDFFSNLPGHVSARYDNPRFFLLAGPVLEGDVTAIEELVAAACFGARNKTWTKIEGVEPRPLVIVAESFAYDSLKWAQQAVLGDIYSKWNPASNSNQAMKAPIMFIKLDIQNPAGYDIFKDLEIAVGARAVDNMRGNLVINSLTDPTLTKDFILNTMGSAERIYATRIDARIVGGDGREEDIAQQIKFIEDQLKKQMMSPGIKPSDPLIQKWRTRMEMLRADMNTILVGGNSFREQRSRLSVYDDCVKAVKSTIVTGGVTIGGNLSIPHYLKHNREQVKTNVIEYLKNNKKNIAIGNDSEAINKALDAVIDVLIDGFGEAYRKVLWNTFVDEDKVKEIYANCIDDAEKCKTYNIVNDKYESIDDYENCELIVPANTDFHILKSVLACLRQLIETTQMISLYSLDLNWADFVKYSIEQGAENIQNKAVGGR